MARLRDRRGKERKEKGERRVRSASIRFIIRAHHPIRNDRRGGRKRDREREEKVFLLFLSFFFFTCDGITHVPFTVSREECVVAPARFDAEHVYSPAWLAATDSIVSTLFFLLVLPMTTSDPWWLPIGVPLNAQDISSG